MSETPTPKVAPEAVKPSKLDRVKNAANIAANVGIYVIPSVAMIGASVLGLRASNNNLEVAKVALELAKLPAQA